MVIFDRNFFLTKIYKYDRCHSITSANRVIAAEKVGMDSEKLGGI
jgi:hypothetical protein